MRVFKKTREYAIVEAGDEIEEFEKIWNIDNATLETMIGQLVSTN